jgi:hypothetical protein
MIKLNSSLAWSSVDDTLVWTGCEATSEYVLARHHTFTLTRTMHTCGSRVLISHSLSRRAIGVPLVFGQILPFTSRT